MRRSGLVIRSSKKVIELKLNPESVQRLRNHGFNDKQIEIVDKYLGGKDIPPNELMIVTAFAAMIEFFWKSEISKDDLDILLKRPINL